MKVNCYKFGDFGVEIFIIPQKLISETVPLIRLINFRMMLTSENIFLSEI